MQHATDRTQHEAAQRTIGADRDCVCDRVGERARVGEAEIEALPC
jgi:hypothetical protein